MRELMICAMAALATVFGLKEAIGPKYVRAAPEIGLASKHLMLDSAMMGYLEMLAETAHVEHARCLEGHFVNDSTYKLGAAFDTPWLVSGQDTASLYFRYDLCPQGTYGWWHAHPWRFVGRWAAEQNVSPANWCTLSEPDRKGERPFFAVVSIRRGLSCVFYRTPDGTYKQAALAPR